MRTLGAYKRRLGVHYIAGRLGRLGRQRQAEVGADQRSAEPVLMQRAAAPCTAHCARAPLSGRALCITDRVRETLQRSAGRILMQQHYLVKICINMAEL